MDFVLLPLADRRRSRPVIPVTTGGHKLPRARHEDAQAVELGALELLAGVYELTLVVEAAAEPLVVDVHAWAGMANGRDNWVPLAEFTIDGPLEERVGRVERGDVAPLITDGRSYATARVVWSCAGASRFGVACRFLGPA